MTDEVEQQETDEQSKSKKTSSAVKVPEEFQIKVAELLKDITKEQCDFLQDECNCKMDEFWKKENTPSFSTESMPE